MSTQKKDLTERKLLLKLELMGAPAQKLVSVARTVYDIEPDYTMVPAKNNLEWHTTDEVLYREAKETYDAITMPFRADPQVYKFESTKEKIWEWNKNNGKQEQKLTKSIVYQSDHDAKRRGKVLKKEKHKDKLEKTFLDPFVLSKKWIKQTIEDKTFYFNIETNERLDHEPPGVWYDKLHLLEKLTPREELDGYEYRESEEERSHRLQYQVRFQKSLKDEIRRREQHPTEIEQVEDVLYDIVNAIHMEAERAAYEEKLEEKRKIWDTWNMATKGYRMKPLGTRETEAGEVYNIVSDFEFNNFIISNTGHMIARTIPKAVLDIHANEREMLAEAKRQHLEMIETERRKPFVQKLRMAMVMMKTGKL